jgi:NAD(P)-dependent dehydrogenase (short-subunit alcohol dehydrogenase family)
MGALTGRVALVTGGAHGIGQAAARRLLGRGARVVVADVDESSGRRLAAADGAGFVRCDVRDHEQVEAAVRHAVDSYGGLDIAFLNAGVTTGCGLGDDFDLAAYRRTMAVNVDGVTFGLVAALAAMRAGSGGDIVVTASLAGLVGVDIDPIYSASKHAIVGLVRSLGPAHASENIRINALCPGFAETEFLHDIRPLVAQTGVPLLGVEDVVDGFVAILDSGRGGECWYVQPGRPSEPFRFRNLPGPRLPGADAGPDGGSERS